MTATLPRIKWPLTHAREADCPACGEPIFWVYWVEGDTEIACNADGHCHRANGACVHIERKGRK